MNEFWKSVLSAGENSTPACLATVIATEGTAPRKEGSKMLIVGGETLKGAVTIGGCVDAQVIEAAEDVARAGEPRLMRMQLGEEDAFDIGLTCAGALKILVEPVKADPALASSMREVLDDAVPFALLTVTSSLLPSIGAGAKMLVAPGRGAHGSLGDPRLDAAADDVARDLLSKGVSRTVALDGNFQRAAGRDQTQVEIFVDVIGYNPDLYIFGAGQVAVPVAALANQAGFRVHVIDTRPRFANRERFPTATEIVVGFPGEFARERRFDGFSFAVLLAHAAKHDLPVLDELLRTDVKYIGVLGSHKRAVALAKRLSEMGHGEKAFSRVKIPIGLDIGAETAEQIAISIVAELVAVRTGGSGENLRTVKGVAAAG